ncbi:transposase [Dysgonomonas macrotermitis]|uniref:Transposase IS200 like n=1 Tax=Dysgonomonas macrotermitis TaxID=1346286 RepID=A0A1M4ZGZ1_9BACT|nr:transposase [Dysgonomonas macrotermitis]SHF17245.1 Transposase IS200 like [Dysgonomonas macrotermitis]
MTYTSATYSKRKNIRLQGYDYSSEGLYFVTICTQNMKCIFGEVTDGKIEYRDSDVGAGLCSALNSKIVHLSDIGVIVQNQWLSLPQRFPTIELFNFIVMPNHFHGIIHIRTEQNPAPTLSDIICAFKSITTKIRNKSFHTTGQKIWQRNYYEHIIRNDRSLIQIADYISSNPVNWQSDRYYKN